MAAVEPRVVGGVVEASRAVAVTSAAFSAAFAGAVKAVEAMRVAVVMPAGRRASAARVVVTVAAAAAAPMAETTARVVLVVLRDRDSRVVTVAVRVATVMPAMEAVGPPVGRDRMAAVHSRREVAVAVARAAV